MFSIIVPAILHASVHHFSVDQLMYYIVKIIITRRYVCSLLSCKSVLAP